MTEINQEDVPKFEIRYYQDGHLNTCYCDLWVVEPFGGMFIITCSEIYFDDVQAVGFPQEDLRQIRQLRGYKEDHEKAVELRQTMIKQISDKSQLDNSDAAFG